MASCSYEKINSNGEELSLEEEKRLIIAAKKGSKEAKETLISYNMGLIHIYASRFAHFNIPYEDLIQEAIIGLLRAINHYNPKLDFRLSSFMSLYILDSLQKLAQTMGYDFGVPKSSLKYNQLQRGRYVYQELETKLKRTPSIEEFAQSMHVNREMSQSLLNAISGCLRLNAKVKDSEEVEMGSFLTSMEESVEDKVMSVDLTKHLSAILSKLLSPKQLFIIYHYYGFEGYEQMSFSEIARLWKIRPQAVHDNYKHALTKLRTYYGMKELTSYLDDPKKGEERLKDYCENYYQTVLKLVPHR